MNHSADGKVPLVIGVIGHRHLRPEDEQPLIGAIKKVILEYQSAYPHTPIVVLSSLAQGADILGAKAAKECGVRVRGVLPMPREAYRASTSFDTEADRQKFDEVCQGIDIIELRMPQEIGPPPTDHWHTIATSKDDTIAEYRRKAYAFAGLDLVRHSDALIAIWDHDEANPKPSGTAEHLGLQLDGIPPQLLKGIPGEPLGAFSERGIAITLYAPRKGQSPDSTKTIGQRDVRTPVRIEYDDKGKVVFPQYERTFGVRMGDVPVARGMGWCDRLGQWYRNECRRSWSLFSDLVSLVGGSGSLGRKSPTIEKAIQDKPLGREEIERHQGRCQTVEQFNRDLSQLPEKSKTPTEEIGYCDRFFDGNQRELLKHLLITRKGASDRASQLDQQIWWLQILIFFLTFLSLFSFHLYAHEFQIVADHTHHNFWFLVGSVLLVVSALCVGMYASMRNLDRRRLEYRVLSEALRVRFWWCVAGVDRAVAMAYPEQVRGEVGWIRQAVRNLCPISPEVWKEGFDSQPTHQKDRLTLVGNKWIADQVKHHFNNTRRKHRASNILHRGGLLLASTAWVGMAFLVAVEISGHALHHFLVAIGMITIGSGLLIGFSEKRSHEELSNQYRRAHHEFRNGLREFEEWVKRGEFDAAQAICERLGIEALNENGQWLTIRSTKPIDIHIA